MKNELNEYITDVTATNTDFTITWTTGDPGSSTTFTVADGAAPTSVEIGVFMGSQEALNAQLIVDIAAIIVKINS